MKVMRNIIEINEELCDGCGQCIISCAEGALEIRNGKAQVIGEKYCDGLGACLGECPTGALTIIEREAEDFDEAAVEALLAQKEKEKPEPCEKETGPIQTKCPSLQTMIFTPGKGGILHGETAKGSELTQWPVQLRLVQPDAPFLKGADLLVAADCTSVAYPFFHRDLLHGKAIVMGCPKFDDRDQTVDRLTNILKTASIKSITLAIIEVPCCSALIGIVDEAQKRAGCKIDMKKKVISVRGHILEEKIA